MSRKYFGTDGIRGRVGQFPITPEFVLKLGWATGVAFRREGVCRVLIGKDTRVSGYMFESALQAGLVAAGADVMLLGPMPTPAIAYLTRTFHAEGERQRQLVQAGAVVGVDVVQAGSAVLQPDLAGAGRADLDLFPFHLVGAAGFVDADRVYHGVWTFFGSIRRGGF